MPLRSRFCRRLAMLHLSQLLTCGDQVALGLDAFQGQRLNGSAQGEETDVAHDEVFAIAWDGEQLPAYQQKGTV
ncbi:hypothetical protein THL1_2019 [Pseudomonas sp. TCU-HL1]|nr:hypothetical protein THL1_2019 [Pseudomonas sp. TCU-HL1]